jgi:predicted phage terminase large subunit-like protein
MVERLFIKVRADACLVEYANAGIALCQDLRRRHNVQFVARKPEGSKQERMLSLSPMIEGGDVMLPVEADWLADFRHEVVHFPVGKHDDQIDSMSQFLLWARQREMPKPTLKVGVHIIRAEPSLDVSDLRF